MISADLDLIAAAVERGLARIDETILLVRTALQAAQGGEGAELATALAQATFVQMRRMFELRLGKDPPFESSGFPLSSIPEGCQVLAEARMYYELKRENKKLRF